MNNSSHSPSLIKPQYLLYAYWIVPLLVGIIMGLEKNQWNWGSADGSWLLLIALQFLLYGLIALFHNIVQDFTKEIPSLQKRLPQVAIPLLCLIALGIWIWQDLNILHQPPLTSLFFLVEATLLAVPIFCILGATGFTLVIVTVFGLGGDIVKPFTLPLTKKKDSP